MEQVQQDFANSNYYFLEENIDSFPFGIERELPSVRIPSDEEWLISKDSRGIKLRREVRFHDITARLQNYIEGKIVGHLFAETDEILKELYGTEYSATQFNPGKMKEGLFELYHKGEPVIGVKRTEVEESGYSVWLYSPWISQELFKKLEDAGVALKNLVDFL